MTSLKYTKKIKKTIIEAENQFTSALNTKLPDNEEKSDSLVSPAIENNLTAKNQEEKTALTAKALEKIKQTLEVSDELQSILNQIDKINKDVEANKWQLNDKNNTAYLPSKNAQIFKQNNYLCLSYNNKVQLFNSVSELHDFLRKHNIPLPHNIKLHEAKDENKVEVKQDVPLFTKMLLNKRKEEYSPNLLSPIEIKQSEEKLLKPLTKFSKETYTLQNKKGDLGIERINDTLYIIKPDGSGWQAIPKASTEKHIDETIKYLETQLAKYQTYLTNPEQSNMDITEIQSKIAALNERLNKYKRIASKKIKQEDVSIGGALGPAVQYTANKKLEEEEDLQEVTPAERGWKPGIVINKNTGDYIRAGEPDPQNKDEFDWTKGTARPDNFAPMWFKWISAKVGPGNVQFYPDRDTNFYANADNFIRWKHGSTARSQLETSSWRQFWKNKVDNEPWEDKMDLRANDHYGLLTISKNQLAAIADDFAAKGYGDLLNGLDINDPDILEKFHPTDVFRPNGFRKSTESPNDIKPGKPLYKNTIDPTVRAKWYEGETNKRNRPTDERLLADFLANKQGKTRQEYLQALIQQDEDRFNGLHNKEPNVMLGKPQQTINTAPAAIQTKSTITNFKQDPVLNQFYSLWKQSFSNPNLDQSQTINGIKQVSFAFKDKPEAWDSLINQLLSDNETSNIDEMDLDQQSIDALEKLKFTESADVELKEDDNPADFATGEPAIANTMATMASDADTSMNTADMQNTTDYTMDNTAMNATPTATPNFGDININTGGGDYTPDMVDPNAMPPMENQPEYKIIDILVDENDPTKIKVKVKDTQTGNIETKDLSEIDA